MSFHHHQNESVKKADAIQYAHSTQLCNFLYNWVRAVIALLGNSRRIKRLPVLQNLL